MKKIKPNRNYKTIKIMTTVISIILFLLIVYNSIYILYRTITNNENIKIFGYTFIIADNNLMKNDYSKNDLLVIKTVDIEEIKKDDIIAYYINKKTRVNKVFNIIDRDGKREYITKSNKNFQPDFEKINKEQIIGKKINKIWKLGFILKLFQSKILSIIILLYIIVLIYFNREKHLRKMKKILNTIKNKE